MKRNSKLRQCLAFAVVLAAAVPAFAQQTKTTEPAEPPSDANRDSSYGYSQTNAPYGRQEMNAHVKDSVPARINKASHLVGMKVRNQQNESLGKIKDVVLDLQSGRIAYIVLSTGGPFRSKFVAVPPSAFVPGADEKTLVLNADKSKLTAAAGFNRNNWPNMATPSWGAEPLLPTPATAPYDRQSNPQNEFDRKPVTEPEKNPTQTPEKYPTQTPDTK
jgi:sporulation protein YlmC with PRC-barrel domain